MAKILIVADSWGYSWYPAQRFKSKLAFEQFSRAQPGDFKILLKNHGQENNIKVARVPAVEIFLEKLGHTVVTIAIPGSSVPQQISFVKNIRPWPPSKMTMQYDQLAGLDLIVWIVTDPLRNLLRESATSNKEFIYRSNNLLTTCKDDSELLDHIYTQSKINYTNISKLSNSKFNGIPVLLAGGAGRVYTNVMYDLEANEPNFCCKLLCGSILEMLTNGAWHHSHLHFTNIPFDSINLEEVDSSIINMLHESVLPEEDEITKLLGTWQTPDPYHMNANAGLFFADLIQSWIEKNIS